jgi:signal transduction histidine kinase
MRKIIRTLFRMLFKWSFEGAALVVLSILFAVVIAGAWKYSVKLRQTVAANAAGINVDPGALIEVEHLRNVAESQIANSRSFFLLGSNALFEKQKKDKQAFIDGLASFGAKYSLPEIPEITKRIDSIVHQQQDIFDQAMGFRAKQTESKIVGQFYQAKTSPLRAQLNENLDEIVKLHNAELERTRTRAQQAGLDAQAQIPRGMTQFTEALGALFLGMALLIVRMIRKRSFRLAERDRLVEAAKKAVLARDEVISALSQDLKEPLAAIVENANALTGSLDAEAIGERAEAIKNSVLETENTIKDICDQKKADLGGLTLRSDQISIDEFLDEARSMMQPFAKQRDVRLQFDAVNPPVMAYFDRERILRVLANLVGNAIKFSRKHTNVVVKVKSDQQFVNISVTDSGAGIPEKQISEIFERFWQARKTSEQGPGIGLAIVKTIVEAHGGTVKVTSLVGHGSTFTFSLPRRRPVGVQMKRPATTVRGLSRPLLPSENPDGPTL